jgi:hypothetical protein
MIVGSALLLFLTVTVGAVVLGFWSHPERGRVDRRSHLLGSAHILLALPAVAIWVLYMIGRRETTATVAIAAITTTLALGISTFLSSRRRDRTGDYGDPPDIVPTAVLVLHGAAAAAALALAIAAAW